MTSKTEIVHFTNAPEIKHFATVKSSPNDNVYGIEWGNIVRKYLEDGYKFPTAKNDIECDGKRYRVLDRGGITAFYDESGDTLFDVENSRLEKEYGIIKSERENATPQSAIGKVIADIEKQAFDNADKEQEDVETNNGNENADVPASDDTDSYEEKEVQGTGESDNGGENDSEVCSDIQKVEETSGENSVETEEMIPMGTASLEEIVKGIPKPTPEEVEAAKNNKPKYSGIDGAVAKLNDFLKHVKANDKAFSEKLIGYLIARVKESESLAEDICQEHKTWDKCMSFLYSRAQKINTQKNQMIAVNDEDVVEWVEDYFHKDDKAEEEEKAKAAKKAKEDSKKCDEIAAKAKARAKAKTSAKPDKNKARADYDTTLKANTDNHKLSAKEIAERKAEEEKKSKKAKKSGDIDGQMDIFSFMGM